MKIETKRAVEFVNDTQELLQNLQDVKEEIEKIKLSLISRQSVIDTQVNELYHLVELNHLSVRDKIKICDELHNLLIERRKTKETMDVINGVKTLPNALKIQTFAYQFTNPVCIEISKKNTRLKRAVYSLKDAVIDKSYDDIIIKVGETYEVLTQGSKYKYLKITVINDSSVQTINDKGKSNKYSLLGFKASIKQGVFKFKEDN